MSENTLKGLVHAGLALASILEYRDSKSVFRKFLLGTATGYHLHAAFYHFVLEKEN